MAEPESEMLPREEVADLKIEAIPGRNTVLSGTRNVVNMVIKICTPKVDESEKQRPTLHVACVMDCSGSMGGEKLRYAKKAVLKLVKHLCVGDTLHVVMYDTNASIVFQDGDLSEAGKEGLRLQVEAMRADGQTNLCDGLELAASLLAGSVADETVMRRIFLFSDGLVNVGITDPQEIKRKVSSIAASGITVNSFGIGADFDEPLMRGIAAAGQGRYQFLATAQDIPKLVSKSVHDLIDIYASDATVDIRGCEHTIVSRVHGSHDQDGTSSAPGLLQVGDIHSDNLRVMLVELDVAPPGNVELGLAFAAVEWVLTCKRNGAPVRVSGQVELSSTRDRASLGHENPTVQMAFAVRRATDLEREVAEHLSHRDRRQAREVKAQQLQLLEEALEAGNRCAGGRGSIGKELELLTVVLERARQVAAQLEDERQDEELMARQCWQDRDDFSNASVCDLRQRANSSIGSDGVADLDDLRDFDDSLSSGSPRGSPGTPPRQLRRRTQSPPSESRARGIGQQLLRLLPVTRICTSLRRSQ